LLALIVIVKGALFASTLLGSNAAIEGGGTAKPGLWVLISIASPGPAPDEQKYEQNTRESHAS
jgi:hypothetical protein